MDYELDLDDEGKPYLKVALTDYALMANSLLNKGMSFTRNEREQFGLIGLLPPHISNLETQRERSYLAVTGKPTDLEKYVYLRDLQDSNETLFYDLLCHHIEELLPIIYTPTVGLGCQRFSHVYRRPRGVFIAYPYLNEIDRILANPRFDHVRTIVVSDGERILGLGDQGAGGMGIPIGKLALYTTCAGLHPSTTLPVLLDTGTNNPDLLKDPLYIGWKHERVRGDDYARLIDAFVTAVKKRFPHVLLQWEDFAQLNANPLLERYRGQLCTFNDDIQGTAAVTAGTLFAAIHVTGTRLRDQRIVIAGAGSAGCGISSLIMRAMIKDGLTESEARKRFFLIDRQGLLTDDMTGLLPFQKPFAHSRSEIAHWPGGHNQPPGLKETVQNVHPTVLIGVSGQPRIFTEEIIRDMAAHVERPVIFPLSNPISMSEASSADILRWTHDKAIIGTGSPAGAVTRFGKSFRIDQTNNCYIFPGVGLGLIAVKSRLVTDEMFMAAASALADASPSKRDPDANLLAPLSEIRKISLHIAIAVAKEAIAAGLAEFNDIGNLEEHIRRHMWTPAYLPYRKI
ncbi:NAD-dependent malic enzyme [Aquicella siphonis]|uniref:NAD-dependent malic enzyme n=1 Tax=Aquicella siphonis TaxID=254247 RepID=A0A5E4PEJ2_9COXI|nr:NAD-dependent malic enzyme [Aquicella siphonis]VVC75254.1 NAD-dependent malic enzyme [Aquicella siphonis]